MRRPNAHACAIILAMGFGALALVASPAVFTIDPSHSRLSVSATLLGMTITEQGPGSLATSMSGTVNAELTTTAIRFPGGSLLDASTNGSWQPLSGGAAGEAPADFAAKTQNPLFGTILAAIREVTLDLQSDVLPLSGTGFDGSLVQFVSPTNSLAAFDYNAGLLMGSKSLAGVSTNKLANGATVTVSAGVQTLTLSIDAQFPFTAFFTNDSLVEFTGKIVATRPLESTAPAPPVIRSIVFSNNQLILQVQGVPEAPYRLESSWDLLHWEACPWEASAKDESYVVPTNPSARSQFYRITR
jgi:hypothetical protein